MKTVCYIDLPVKDNGHGVAVRKLHENNFVQVMHITLNPGEKVDTHTTPVDVFFYILEGTCAVGIGDEKKLASKDTLIESPAMIPHALYNESPSLARILVVKTPGPSPKK